MASLKSEILTGIEDELASTDAYIIYEVAERKRDGELWTLTLDLSKSTKGAQALDESLEGAAAWWPGPPKATADVLAVVPEEEQIHLRFATGVPPDKGERIWLYLPRYLEALAECWSAGYWGDGCVEWLSRAFSDNTFDPAKVLDPDAFPWLRLKQKEAFDLPGWNVSFLDGPPGTGKTTTLGAVLAQYLVEFPFARVLLLSTTNVAVDQALVSVDKALEQLEIHCTAATRARGACFRLGNHFVASEYKGREHLIPVPDIRLVKEKQQLEAEKPPATETRKYAQWKRAMEKCEAAIRAYMAGVLDRSMLAAMTTTRAVFTFGEIRKRAPFDLIVFDEASQVGRAHALALAPLGRRCLFAGDPQQLSPIVRSTHPDAVKWLGSSMFHYRAQVPKASCRLVEQSRMAEPICRVVSGAFYDGDLIVAKKESRDPTWLRERTLADVPPMGAAGIYIHPIDEEGRWLPKLGGNIRFASAVAVAEIVAAISADLPLEDIVVLTPFRAQRALIRMRLGERKLRRVSVSTVHRAQGSERHTVVFDPTKGDSNFLQREEAGQLINVALSRAKARLILMISDGDRENLYLKRVLEIAGAKPPQGPIPDLLDLATTVGFPASCLGSGAAYKGLRGSIVAVSSAGDRFTFRDAVTAKERSFETERFVRAATRHQVRRISP